MMKFKHKLKTLRKKAVLTQKQLSELSGIPLTTIQKYERGVFEPKIQNLYKLADVLKVEPMELINSLKGGLDEIHTA